MAIKRASFTDEQKVLLSKFYENSPYPTTVERQVLASSMKKPVKHIANWFKNERARLFKSFNKPQDKPRTRSDKNRSIKIVEKLEKKSQILISSAVAIKSEPLFKVSRHTNSNDSTYIPSVQSNLSNDSNPGELQIVTDEEIDVSAVSDPGQLQILNYKEIDVSGISEYSGTGQIASTPFAVKDNRIADDTFSKLFYFIFTRT
jgi:hypothetical protein